MNKIEFRAKNLKGEWEYGYYLEFELCDGEGRCSYIKKDGCQPIKVLKETVGQFTGLLDKTSKEIYEGDVLKSSLTIGIPNTGCYHEIGELFVVVCMLSGYTLVSMRDYRYENRRSTPSLVWNLDNKFLWNYHNKFEVIGNIHDNPELINS